MRTIPATLLALALLSLGYAQTPTSSENQSTENEIRQMIEQFRTALLKRDTDALARIWADNYTFINAKGAVLTKAQRVANLKSGATKFDTMEADKDITVVVYGNDLALATGRLTIKGQYSGKATSGQFQSRHVWAKLPSGWQLVSNQITPIAPP